MIFVLVIGVFASSWLGGLIHQAGEWLICRVPLVKQVCD